MLPKSLLKKETLLFLLIVISFGWRVFSVRESYTTRYSPDYWKNIYEKSQWNVPFSKTGLGDSGLYAYAGWEYIHGKNPILINPEMPPFGKLLFGLSILLFGNPNVISLILTIIALITLFFISMEILHDRSLSLLVVLLVSIEKLFFEQVNTSMLEMPHLLFLLLVILFFIKAQKRTAFFVMMGIFLGMFMATKTFFIGLILFATVLITQIFIAKRKLPTLIISSIPAMIIYTSSYAGFFLNGHSFREFLGLHKWIVNFYQNSLVTAYPGAPFWMLIFNRWEVWFKGSWFGEHFIESVDRFNIIWPIITIFSLVFIGMVLKNITRSKIGLLIISIWIILYAGFLSFIPIWPRYLVLLIPFLYLLTVCLLFKTHFLSDIYVALRKEMATHKKEYTLMAVSVILFIILIKILFLNQDFVFTPLFGHDFQIARDLVFRYKLSTPINPLMLPWYIFLTIPFFLSDGNPRFIIPFMTITAIIIAYVIYRVVRRQAGKLAIPFFNLTLVFISLTLTLAGRLKLSLPSNSFLMQENEISVIDKTYAWSNEEKFIVAILNDEKNDYHYHYLYSQYGKRKYRSQPEFFPYGKANIYYLIAEPVKNEKNITEFREKFFLEGQIEKEEKLPTGITLIKIRLPNQNGNEK